MHLRTSAMGGRLAMRVEVEPLPLKAPFRISGYTFTDVPVAVATLQSGAARGRGEAAGVYYLQDTPALIAPALEAHRDASRPGIDRDAPCADRYSIAELSQVTTQCVDPRGAGAEIARSDTVQRHYCLLLNRLYRHRRQPLIAGRLQQCLCICPVGLVAVAIPGHIRGVQQPDPMTKPLRFASPVVC